MANVFYKKPFRLKQIFVHEDLLTTDLGVSISQNIELIIFTRYGEHRYNPDFGCEIWDLDFELIVSESLWEEKFRQSLLRSINTYEQRLYEIDVEIKMVEVEKYYPLRDITEVKKRVDIYINGRIQETGERYHFSTSLFLSPLST